MSTLLISHPVCMCHNTGPYHPDRPERLVVIERKLSSMILKNLKRQAAPPVTPNLIAQTHHRSYVDYIFSAAPKPKGDYTYLSSDTILSPSSIEAAIRSVGAVVSGVKAVASGMAHNVFCLIRPPGHHAEPTAAMGFCIFNNVAVGAWYARTHHYFQRVAVIDFDAHHGNGTQLSFWDEADMLYISMHQYPCYPGTGRVEESGCSNNIINILLTPRSSSAEFRYKVITRILPVLQTFKPQILFVSAGFDAHTQDSSANINLTEEDFAWVTRILLYTAAEYCDNRIVSVLEGGYDLETLADSVAGHIQELTGVFPCFLIQDFC